MDSQENANTQTKEQHTATEEKSKKAEEAVKPTIPAKPKQTYKCLVCGKS